MGKPLCATTADKSDEGTLCLHKTNKPGISKGKTSTSGKKDLQKAHLAENQKYLSYKNVTAFLSAIAEAEGGDYNLKYGGVKGKKNDKWKFSDFSTHPGAGAGGKTTAAGMYQINKPTWHEMGDKMGLSDFSSTTQDLLAVEIIRTIGAITKVVSGDIDGALAIASRRWAALPQGKGKSNRYPGQPYLDYDKFVAAYKHAGGTIEGESDKK